MTTHHPDPEVYRDAARLIDSGKKGYTFVAIQDVCQSRRFGERTCWRYKDQYGAMFGPFVLALLLMADICEQGFDQ